MPRYFFLVAVFCLFVCFAFCCMLVFYFLFLLLLLNFVVLKQVCNGKEQKRRDKEMSGILMRVVKSIKNQ